MGTAQLAFVELVRCGATGSHVTGSRVTGSDVTGSPEVCSAHARLSPCFFSY